MRRTSSYILWTFACSCAVLCSNAASGQTGPIEFVTGECEEIIVNWSSIDTSFDGATITSQDDTTFLSVVGFEYTSNELVTALGSNSLTQEDASSLQFVELEDGETESTILGVPNEVLLLTISKPNGVVIMKSIISSSAEAESCSIQLQNADAYRNNVEAGE